MEGEAHLIPTCLLHEPRKDAPIERALLALCHYVGCAGWGRREETARAVQGARRRGGAQAIKRPDNICTFSLRLL